MSDIIKLLPDAIANQIAAGEVIQRPASVVKELMENAIDAGSSSITLIIKDAGKTLVQVIDNGKGMTETDARMAFERHATSKISVAKDLFSLKTMGFRGEAMASIASIAHVSLTSRTPDQEIATQIKIKGSKVEEQAAVSAPVGTNVQVKNLFYNVPARRKFLKSDPTELKHILDEFQRITLAHPNIYFKLFNNENELFHLPNGNLRQRIVGVFGKTYNERIVPVEEKTDWVEITGFVGKPDKAKRSRGEQFLFVNNRFIKSNYLNHAIKGAYSELIPDNHNPLYVIFIKMDPAKIDVNVHPTKQEIKFEDERLIYNYLKVSIKHALGKYTLTPILDFEESNNFIQRSDGFSAGNFSTDHQKETWNNAPKKTKIEKANIDQWESIYRNLQSDISEDMLTIQSQATSDDSPINPESLGQLKDEKKPYQIHNSYIISQIKSGFLLIDQQAAHERILYEKHLNNIKDQNILIQKQLFATTIELDTKKATLLQTITEKLYFLGFEINHFGDNSFVIQGLPANLDTNINIQELIEQVLEQYEAGLELQIGIDENVCRVMAQAAAIKKGERLNTQEMEDLINQLFACETPFKTPFGKNCFITMELQDIKKRFNN